MDLRATTPVDYTSGNTLTLEGMDDTIFLILKAIYDRK